MVRNKVDVAIRSALDAQEEEDGALDEQQRQDVQDTILGNIRDRFSRDSVDNVYLISATPLRMRTQYDFPNLERDIQTSLIAGRGVDVSRDCPVCWMEYENYGGQGGPREATPCGHSICGTCLEQIMRTAANPLCPLCRQRMDEVRDD